MSLPSSSRLTAGRSDTAASNVPRPTAVRMEPLSQGDTRSARPLFGRITTSRGAQLAAILAGRLLAPAMNLRAVFREGIESWLAESPEHERSDRQRLAQGWLEWTQEQDFPASVCALDLELGTISELPDVLQFCKAVHLLKITGSQLRTLPDWIGQLTQLWSLEICNAELLGSLPEALSACVRLSSLQLRGCSRFLDFPASLGELDRLEILGAQDCTSLRRLPASIQQCPQLRMISLKRCPSFDGIDEAICHCRALRVLRITECDGVRSIAPEIDRLVHLQELRLDGCTWLTTVPASLLRLPTSCRVHLTGCGLSNEVVRDIITHRVRNADSTPDVTVAARPKIELDEYPIDLQLTHLAIGAGHPIDEIVLRFIGSMPEEERLKLRKFLVGMTTACRGTFAYTEIYRGVYRWLQSMAYNFFREPEADQAACSVDRWLDTQDGLFNPAKVVVQLVCEEMLEHTSSAELLVWKEHLVAGRLLPLPASVPDFAACVKMYKAIFALQFIGFEEFDAWRSALFWKQPLKGSSLEQICFILRHLRAFMGLPDAISIPAGPHCPTMSSDDLLFVQEFISNAWNRVDLRETCLLGDPFVFAHVISADPDGVSRIAERFQLSERLAAVRRKAASVQTFINETMTDGEQNETVLDAIQDKLRVLNVEAEQIAQEMSHRSLTLDQENRMLLRQLLRTIPQEELEFRVRPIVPTKAALSPAWERVAESILAWSGGGDSLEQQERQELASWLLHFMKDEDFPANIPLRFCLHFPRIRELPEALFAHWQFRELALENWHSLESIPESIGENRFLESLHLWHCHRLNALPRRLVEATRLRSLEIVDCPELEQLPPHLERCESLYSIEVADCPKIRALPPSTGLIPNLRFLSMVRTGATELPRSIWEASNLTRLAWTNLAIGPLAAQICSQWNQRKRTTLFQPMVAQLKEAVAEELSEGLVWAEKIEARELLLLKEVWNSELAAQSTMLTRLFVLLRDQAIQSKEALVWVRQILSGISPSQLVRAIESLPPSSARCALPLRGWWETLPEELFRALAAEEEIQDWPACVGLLDQAGGPRDPGPWVELFFEKGSLKRCLETTQPGGVSRWVNWWFNTPSAFTLPLSPPLHKLLQRMHPSREDLDWLCEGVNRQRSLGVATGILKMLVEQQERLDLVRFRADRTTFAPLLIQLWQQGLPMEEGDLEWLFTSVVGEQSLPKEIRSAAEQLLRRAPDEELRTLVGRGLLSEATIQHLSPAFRKHLRARWLSISPTEVRFSPPGQFSPGQRSDRSSPASTSSSGRLSTPLSEGSSTPSVTPLQIHPRLARHLAQLSVQEQAAVQNWIQRLHQFGRPDGERPTVVQPRPWLHAHINAHAIGTPLVIGYRRQGDGYAVDWVVGHDRGYDSRLGEWAEQWMDEDRRVSPSYQAYTDPNEPSSSGSGSASS
jgi:hypothetical protein